MTKKISAELAAILAVADDGTHTEINAQGTKIWRNAAGKYHRDGDFPACIWVHGDVFYYKNGKQHRDGDLPAVIHADGTVFYFKNGKQYTPKTKTKAKTKSSNSIGIADDGAYPMIDDHGTEIWRNAAGKKHRDGDLPAVIHANGSVFYYKNDKLHRDGDLPAVILSDGIVVYYKNGKRYTPETKTKTKSSNPDGIADDGTHTEIDHGTKIWRNAAGKRHRDGDLPAMVYSDGSVSYYKDGKLHRDGDLPAMIYSDGEVAYFKNGLCHRDGGLPAIIYADGTVFYFKNGKQYTPETKAETKSSNPTGIADDGTYPEIDEHGTKIWRNAAGKIHRDGDLPAMVYSDGTVFYYKDGKKHRDGDLPAVIYADSSVSYYKDGKLHRDGGLPAIIYADGSEIYCKNGKQYTPKTETKSSNPVTVTDDGTHNDANDGGDLTAALKTEIVAIGFKNTDGKLCLIRCTANSDYIRIRMAMNEAKSSNDYQNGKLVIWDINADTWISLDENSVIVWGVIQ